MYFIVCACVFNKLNVLHCQSEASKTLLAVMESTRDNELAERILNKMTSPSELVCVVMGLVTCLYPIAVLYSVCAALYIKYIVLQGTILLHYNTVHGIICYTYCTVHCTLI